MAIEWCHLSELPESVRAVLKAETEKAEIEDRTIIQATLKAITQSRLAMRVPHYCHALRRAHPEMDKRTVFVAVALVTGISKQHVKRLFYGETQP